MARSDTPSLQADTSGLAGTTVVAALDSPLPPGKNAIWCGSFLAAWQRIEELVGAPVQFGETAAIRATSASSPASSDWLPDGDSYSRAGWIRDGVVADIQREMARLFPGCSTPTFPLLPQDAAVAYGFSQCSMRFPVAYFDSTEPMPFIDFEGRSTPVRTFGVRMSDANGALEQRNQARVLFNSGGADGHEFALDLCRTSTQVQIVFARIGKADTLARMIANVHDMTAHAGPRSRVPMLLPMDVMLVPNMNWQIAHHFLSKDFLAQVIQDTRFRLDRHGVELKSEATMSLVGGGADVYAGSGPFLVYITRRDAPVPFLAVWIETAELLERF